MYLIMCLLYTIHLSVFKMACDKLLDVVGGLVPPNQIPTKTLEDQGRIKTKARKGERIVQFMVFI